MRRPEEIVRRSVNIDRLSYREGVRNKEGLCVEAEGFWTGFVIASAKESVVPPVEMLETESGLTVAVAKDSFRLRADARDTDYPDFGIRTLIVVRSDEQDMRNRLLSINREGRFISRPLARSGRRWRKSLSELDHIGPVERIMGGGYASEEVKELIEDEMKRTKMSPKQIFDMHMEWIKGRV